MIKNNAYKLNLLDEEEIICDSDYSNLSIEEIEKMLDEEESEDILVYCRVPKNLYEIFYQQVDLQEANVNDVLLELIKEYSGR